MTSQQIEDFLKAAEAKYDKGQAEHGGLITDRDLKNEITNELIDLAFYKCAEHVKNGDIRCGEGPGSIKVISLGVIRNTFFFRKDSLTEWWEAWRALVELTLNNK